jgi:hypothetical protein
MALSKHYALSMPYNSQSLSGSSGPDLQQCSSQPTRDSAEWLHSKGSL